MCDQIHHTKHQMLHLMYYIILNPKRHQVGHSNKEMCQPKHQVHHLNEKNMPTKTPSTLANFKEICQPNHHVRHLNQKNAPTKITKYAIWMKRIHQPKIKNVNLYSKILIYAVLSRGKFCREFTHFFGVPFTGLKNVVAYQKWQLSGMASGWIPWSIERNL